MADQDYEDRNDEALDEQAQEGEDEQKKPAGWAGWLISGTFHVLLLAVLTTVYWVIKNVDEDKVPLRSVKLDPPQQKQERQKPDRTIVAKLELENPVESEVPNPHSEVELPTVEVSTTEDELDTDQRKGREEAVADSEMGSQAFFAAIGAGGGASGLFGNRTGGNRHRSVSREGGSRGSENGVEAALRWFKKHQSPNGQWDAVRYPINCTEDQKCEPGAVNHGTVDGANVAMTGYAVLCYLGAGYDHLSPNHYRMVVKKGLDYLVSVQKADGYLGDRNYENAVGTTALAEAYAMTSDPALKEPAQKAVNSILAHQNQADGGAKDEGYGNGLGWDYTGPSMRNDSSVSGWNVMALKSALAGGLNVGHGLDGSKRWLDTVWKTQNPDWSKLDPYTGESRFPYTYATDSKQTMISPAPAWDHDMECVGAVCAVFLGHRAGDAMLETLSNYIVAHQLPNGYPTNTYYLYYNTIAMFQVGGEKWQKWNHAVRDMLVNAQRKGDGCFDGSWNPQGTMFPGNEVGRVLSTAYCCLCLEVYYRDLRVSEEKAKK
jgi:hypothetical protein